MARVSRNDKQKVRYRTEALGYSKDELAAAVARVGNSTDAVRREVYRHWAYAGHVGQARLRRKNYRDGNEDDRASEREPVACTPALSVREHVTCSEPTVTPINSAISSRLLPRSTRFLICSMRWA